MTEMIPDKYKHPPGDPQAVADGCTCPVTDNAHGKGCGYVDSEGWPLYVFNHGCPLHGGDKAEEMDPETLCFEAGEYAERHKSPERRLRRVRWTAGLCG